MTLLSKLSLLKERRERIISHLLNIRFIHNAAGVFIGRGLLPLLIAVMVAGVELVSVCPPPTLTHSYFLKSKMFDVAVVAAVLKNAGFVYFIIIFLCLLMCCSLCPSAASDPIELRGSGLIYYLMD